MHTKKEIRSVYNSNREKTGEFVTGTSLEKGSYYVTVIAFLENEQGEFLVQKCSVQKGGKYSSTGGHPKKDETSLQGIHTEILEELGVNLPKEEITLVATEKQRGRFVDVYHAFLNKNTKFSLQEEEVAEVHWMSTEQILELIQKDKFAKTHADMFTKYIHVAEKNDRPDVKIKTENCHFKFRVRGILEKNEKILCVCMQDADFFCLPGGHVEVGELTKDTIIREMQEETKTDVKIDNLVLISEDVYLRREKLVHELAYYYKVSPLNVDTENNDFLIYEKDKDGIKKLEFKWFSKEEFKNVNFKPEYLKNKILQGDYSFEHIQNN